MSHTNFLPLKPPAIANDQGNEDCDNRMRQLSFKSWSEYKPKRKAAREKNTITNIKRSITSETKMQHNELNSSSRLSIRPPAMESVLSTALASGLSSNQHVVQKKEQHGKAPRLEGSFANSQSGSWGAMDVPAAPGIATPLQYQWIRLHPSVGFQVDSILGNIEKPPSISSSCLAGIIQTKIPKNGGQSNLMHCENRSKDNQQSSDRTEKTEFKEFDEQQEKKDPEKIDKIDIRQLDIEPESYIPGRIEIELSDLFNSPLQSEWIPGVATECSYYLDEDDVNIQARNIDQTLNSCNLLQVTTGKILPLILAIALDDIPAMQQAGEIGTELLDVGEHPKRSLLQNAISPFTNSTCQELATLMPSQLFISAVSEIAMNNQLDEASRNILKVNVLCTIAESISTRNVAYHIIRFLAPAIFSSACSSTTIAVNGCIFAVHRLSHALVYDCGLKLLDRIDFSTHYLFTSIDENQCDSDIYNEFICCLGEDYSSARK